MRDRTPNHPFLDVGDVEFLFRISAMRRDRESNRQGLTAAGLLMFGQAKNIADESPHYLLDFQERDKPRTEARWIDRITIDGTWSGNLYDFYRRVYRKLVADLKIPFVLHDGERQDETPVHQALREALVNSIVHADYSGRSSVLVVKRPDMFGFRNPGRMRVPIANAIQGGESDGRNRLLQKMFLLIGAGEQAGSGVPKIHKGWADQHWAPPQLYEVEQPSEQTRLELRMTDLIPVEALDRLRGQFGAEFDALGPDHRLVLAIAAVEGVVTHTRMQSVCTMHPVDLTRMLQLLVQSGFLDQSGRTKGASYRLPLTPEVVPDPVFDGNSFERQVAIERHKPLELSTKPLEFEAKALELPYQPQPVMEELDPGTGSRRVIDDLATLSPEERARFDQLAQRVSGSGRTPVPTMQDVVLRICDGYFVTAKTLATIISRNEIYVRQTILASLVQDGRLLLMYPAARNHPRQAYIKNSASIGTVVPE